MGTAVLNMNDEFNLFGQKAYISGSSFEAFPPISDAPTEKGRAIEQQEEVVGEGSLFGNLALGVLVSASLGALTYVAFGAAFAAATVATGGVLLLVGTCLAAATAAAATVTIATAVTDVRSGHARPVAEFAAQLATGAALGAVSGATLYGLFYGIPGASMLLGADLAGLFASSSPVAAVAFSKATALAGVFLMGGQAIRSASEIASLGTGHNWMLEKVFGGDIGTYNDTAMLMDALSAYTIMAGWEVRPGKENVSRETVVENAAKKTNPGFLGGDAGKDYLNQTYGGEAQVQIKTSLTYRYVDTIADYIAHESKVGYNKYTQAVIKQIMKDAEILQSKRDGIVGYIWHFFTSEITGESGADPRVLELLIENGIEYIMHDLLKE